MSRNLRGDDDDRQAKHYPLHKLMGQCAKASRGGLDTRPDAFDESISSVGNRLISDLQQAENLEGEARNQGIEAAFNLAMNSLSAIADQLQRPTLEEFVNRA